MSLTTSLSTPPGSESTTARIVGGPTSLVPASLPVRSPSLLIVCSSWPCFFHGESSVDRYGFPLIVGRLSSGTAVARNRLQDEAVGVLDEFGDEVRGDAPAGF